MQLARIWREHVAAGCPADLAGIEIAGSDARALERKSVALSQTSKSMRTNTSRLIVLGSTSW
jgi:hypothetical protein